MKQRALIIFNWSVKFESGAMAALIALLTSVPGGIEDIDVAMVVDCPSSDLVMRKNLSAEMGGGKWEGDHGGVERLVVG